MIPLARQIESIFAAALEQEGEEGRHRFLDEACAGDAALRRRVEELIDNHFQAGAFLGSPAAELAAALTGLADESRASRIGRYRLLEPIGEGGFGVVYRAEQEEPVRRQVALKLIKPGMGTRQVIARFEAERQALALMDHPNIARVLDAGTTASGRPFFVMELVQGLPLTKFCDERKISPRERLGLFVQVCQAVQHAHQKGVIHRDLKPSNVLVTTYDGRPVPKVIDFGVAKATGPRLTDLSVTTECGSVVGTLPYMSPEQAELGHLDIDTRSDIYSLGVLLYELLTGTTPLGGKPLQEVALLEALRVIREEEPPRPSHRLGTAEELPRIAAERGLDPRELRRLVRGELDWIVMRCLEKDRDRRYDTADGLARDVQRYLAEEPVEACPPTAAYRLRKFARRNGKLLATAGAFAAVLLLSAAVTVRQALQLARAEREEAERVGFQAGERARRTREINEALNKARDLREQARGAPGRWDKWAEAKAMARRAEALVGEGATDHRLAGQVEELLAELGQEEADRQVITRLEELRLAQTDFDQQRYFYQRAKALPGYRLLFQEYGLPVGSLPTDAVVGRLRQRPAPVQRAVLAAMEHWLDLARRAKAPEADALLRVLSALDTDPWRQRLRAARAKAQPDRDSLLRLAHEVDVAAQGPEVLLVLASALRTVGATDEGIALLRRTQEAYPGHFWSNYDLAMAVMNRKPPYPEEAIRYLTAAVALRPENLGVRNALAITLSKAGRFPEAGDVARQMIRLNPRFSEGHGNLGLILAQQGHLEQAVAAFRRAIDLKPDSGAAWANLGIALERLGRIDEALDAYRRGSQVSEASEISHYGLGRIYGGMGRLEDSAAAFRRAVELKPSFSAAHVNLGVSLLHLARPDEAVAAFREGVRLEPQDALGHSNLGQALSLLGRYEEALAAFREAVRAKPAYVDGHRNLATTLLYLGRFAEALESFRRADDLGGGRASWPSARGRWVEETRRLVELECLEPAILRGEVRPATAAERNEYARFCYFKGSFAQAAGLWLKAFEEDPALPGDPVAGNRLKAAFAAAQAGAGRGGDGANLGERDRARWRGQARDWLAAEFATYMRALPSATAGERQVILRRVSDWRILPSLAGLRDPAELAKLPVEERRACEQLWADVIRLFKRAE